MEVSIRAAGIPLTSSTAAVRGVGDMVVVTNDSPAPLAMLTVGRIWAHGAAREWAERTGRTLYPVHR